MSLSLNTLLTIYAFAEPFQKLYFDAKQSVNIPSPHNLSKKSVGKHKQNQRNKYK